MNIPKDPAVKSMIPLLKLFEESVESAISVSAKISKIIIYNIK